MKAWKMQLLFALVLLVTASWTCWSQGDHLVVWKHLSSKNGDLPAPNAGDEQTSAVVADFDKDGIDDFAISERTQAPAVVWYRRNDKGWTLYILEDQPLHIEAGSCAYDVDGDGDLDYVAGGDWKLNEVWWWVTAMATSRPRWSPRGSSTMNPRLLTWMETGPSTFSARSTTMMPLASTSG